MKAMINRVITYFFGSKEKRLLRKLEEINKRIKRLDEVETKANSYGLTVENFRTKMCIMHMDRDDVMAELSDLSVIQMED